MKKFIGHIYLALVCAIAIIIAVSPSAEEASPEIAAPPAPGIVSEVPPELVGVNLDPAQELLVKVAATKWGAWLMAAIVACRFLVKPALSYLRHRAAQTPGIEDDRRLEAIERSRWFAILSYVLDMVFSVKLQPKQ